MISVTGSVTLVTLGGIIGSQLTRIPELATLPVSLVIISAAITAIPATILMRRIGRKFGSALAALSASAAMLLAVYALSVSSFTWFSIATAIFGINMAFPAYRLCCGRERSIQLCCPRDLVRITRRYRWRGVGAGAGESRTILG